MSKGRKKGESYITIIGMLDNSTRLVADKHCFMIQVLVKNKEENIWVSRYSYSGFGDALRGYMKHCARESNRNTVSKPIIDLIEHVAALDKRVDELSLSLKADIEKLMKKEKYEEKQ